MGRPLIPIEKRHLEVILDKEAVRVVEHSRSFGAVSVSSSLGDYRTKPNTKGAPRK
jgi:hypothetical protein